MANPFFWRKYTIHIAGKFSLQGHMNHILSGNRQPRGYVFHDQARIFRDFPLGISLAIQADGCFTVS
jgi:hypothetical protein